MSVLMRCFQAGCEDGTAAEVRGMFERNISGGIACTMRRFAAHRPAAGSGSVRVSMGCPGAEAVSRRR